MYKLAGIIAEYDPFHNGHAWQLQQAKALGAQRVAVAMSCGLSCRICNGIPKIYRLCAGSGVRVCCASQRAVGY